MLVYSITQNIMFDNYRRTSALFSSGASYVSRIKHLIIQFSQLVEVFPQFNSAYQANAF